MCHIFQRNNKKEKTRKAKGKGNPGAVVEAVRSLFALWPSFGHCLVCFSMNTCVYMSNAFPR